MSGPRGLGRGLDALLGSAPLPVAPAQTSGLREIPLDRIVPNPFQPRKAFDESSMIELRASIDAHGVLVPIIVRPRGDRFQIVAGERRWRACAALQRSTIPAIVREESDRASLEMAIVENLQREDLNALEEAAGFAQLVDDYDLTQEQVAQRVGRSRSAVANALRLLGLPDAIKAMIADGRLTGGHARALLAAPESERLALAARAAAEGLPVRALERLASAQAAPRAAPPAAARSLSAEEREFENRLRERFGTRVAIVHTGSGGRIEFHFSGARELMDLGDRLLES
ncbi:MAG TPA: ParB/RepB/Spo0J family partition protein [Candidatus Dormibacteraeota bacterium]|nr:ParB/RepB/Spo0J family partition protein [Candidatus Dormibacteraeota bacterium]